MKESSRLLLAIPPAGEVAIFEKKISGYARFVLIPSLAIRGAFGADFAPCVS